MPSTRAPKAGNRSQSRGPSDGGMGPLVVLGGGQTVHDDLPWRHGNGRNLRLLPRDSAPRFSENVRRPAPARRDGAQPLSPGKFDNFPVLMHYIHSGKERRCPVSWNVRCATQEMPADPDLSFRLMVVIRVVVLPSYPSTLPERFPVHPNIAPRRDF